jgi:hypothetical protein
MGHTTYLVTTLGGCLKNIAVQVGISNCLAHLLCLLTCLVGRPALFAHLPCWPACLTWPVLFMPISSTSELIFFEQFTYLRYQWTDCITLITDWCHRNLWYNFPIELTHKSTFRLPISVTAFT